MLISSEQQRFSLPIENGAMSLNSSPPGSEQVGIELPESPQVPTTFTDLNVVPEKEKNQLEQTISNSEEELLGLKLKQRSLDDKRREALNKILDIKGCIRVFCRVRPIVLTKKRRIQQPISVESEKTVVRSAGTRKEFVFDKVFPQEANQDEVFVEVEPILRSALDGHNICVIAYGQTGTGKTYTMDGTRDSPGIVPRALEELFRQASLDSAASYTFSISMLEVYLGHLRDLLAPRLSCRKFAVSRCNLNIQIDSKGSVEIEGLTEMPISNFTKAIWWYNKGTRCRSTSWTNVNEASSRSHCLTKITINRLGNISGGKPEVSKLWMVDLGGSERLLKTGATGKTLDEGRAINLSLSALGDVIAGLRRKRGHVPYRNSKLTQILRDSLGDASKALLLVHVSPYEEDAGETTCSFTFAKRARGVEFNRELPEEVKKQKEKRIADLEEEMRAAEEESKKLKYQIENIEFLLNKSKKLLEEEEKTSILPIENLQEVTETLQMSKKALITNVTNSWPRFMNSTVASRQRQNSAEKQIDGRARILRSGTRSAVQISGSQCISYIDPHFKAFLRISDKKPQNGETDITHMESAKCNGSDFKQSAAPRGIVIGSSGANLKGLKGHHRRRMSDLL